VALVLAVGVLSAAMGKTQKPRLAVMPAQYMAADARSAHVVTNELAYQFVTRGYSVVTNGQSQATFRAMRLQPDRPYGDPVAAQFGRRLGADLVVYPQLLAVGTPYGRPGASARLAESGAVLHLRVVSARTGRRLYSRQVRQPFLPGDSSEGAAAVTHPQAVALATRTTGLYFQRVAGSREELHNAR
jgi:hypothetical protein